MGSLDRFVHCRKFRSKHYGWLVDDPSRGTFHNAITRIVSYFDSPATTLFFEAELLGMREISHRVVVDLRAAATSGRADRDPKLLGCLIAGQTP
jgi:hypothetical protein